MKKLLILLSITGLLLTVVPSFLVFYGILSWKTHSILMVFGFFFYFGSAPFWMKSTGTLDS